MDNENFGLAKSFSSAPVLSISPHTNFSQKEQTDIEHELNEQVGTTGEYVSEGFCFKLAPGQDQIGFMRSLKEKAPKLTDFAKGTTTLAFEFQEGVLVAVDARATMGAFISSNNVRKVIEINDFLLGTMAGGAADCMFWEKYVAMQCRVYELRNGEKPSVAMASMMLASIMRQYRGQGLSMGTMFTGSDKTGASLYYIDNDATRVKGRLFAVGSGGTFAYGVLDTNYRYDMSLDEAVNLGIRAITSATFKDSASGGVVRIYHVTNHGKWNLIHDAIDVSELHYQFEQNKGHTGRGNEGKPNKYL
ncbi:proteasome subunit beta [Stylonychia lemnae]|uniref:Proteasome subunit beta n=1 Tax=Stylonychia lemnae TaxID=5949 RepID=A0A078BA85_STYLE|nr:proteasome subunit beta [Stylonychia lemnae]|eukprot:CDW91435.1 proteasome subunit beta [Stylonychia lemnae]